MRWRKNKMSLYNAALRLGFSKEVAAEAFSMPAGEAKNYLIALVDKELAAKAKSTAKKPDSRYRPTKIIPSPTKKTPAPEEVQPDPAKQAPAKQPYMPL
jgi:hypothetical protein